MTARAFCLKFCFFLLCNSVALLLCRLSFVFAFESPNNKFGIHLAVPDQNDLIAAANLVNSRGGDWGYVTMVMQDDDLDQDKWQNIFDQLRELHLIPLIRLATHLEGESWGRPTADQARTWANFLDSLNWVVKKRYVILFNEPNHASEWGGRVDPASYYEVAEAFIAALKDKNPDFFVLLAALDAAAPHQPPQYESESAFLRPLQDLLPRVDGWASHIYQGGEPFKKDLNLPVFVTEAGLSHAEGVQYDKKLPPAAKIVQPTLSLLQKLVANQRVMAVTPFILNYQAEPFDHFSWQKLNSSDFYPQYAAVQNLPKVAGQPEQIQLFSLESTLPQKLLVDSTYQIPLKIKNLGQATWSLKDDYQLHLILPADQSFTYFFSDFANLKPFQTETFWLHFKTADQHGPVNLKIAVAKNSEVVSNLIDWPVEILPQINLNLTSPRLLARFNSSTDFKLVIYDQDEQVVYIKEKLTAVNGRIKVEGINNLTLDQLYRLVILKEGYLPRQTFLTPGAGENTVVFKPLLPDLKALFSRS
jgi:hypothetical protein